MIKYNLVKSSNGKYEFKIGATPKWKKSKRVKITLT